MKIASIIGARPQFIKAAVVSPEIRRVYSEIVIHTGQHYDPEMSDTFFKELALPVPHYNLKVGSSSQGKQTAQILEGIEAVLLKEKPDLVLVYGDTNSTLAGALASSKLDIPLAHIEAGLRSFNRSMPEEINRLVTDHVATLLFCPTETAVSNLAAEGITEGVFFSGDVMHDAIRCYSERAQEESHILANLDVEPKNYLLCTIHRAENTDSPHNLTQILEALAKIEQTVVFPVHPRTKKAIKHLGLGGKLSELQTVRFIPPVSYLDMLKLEQNAQIVLTDSGGVQKEAYLFRVPCLTLRRETEWVETLRNGWNKIVEVERERIVAEVKKALAGRDNQHDSPFGAGGAALRITESINEYFITTRPHCADSRRPGQHSLSFDRMPERAE